MNVRIHHPYVVSTNFTGGLEPMDTFMDPTVAHTAVYLTLTQTYMRARKIQTTSHMCIHSRVHARL